MTLTTALNSVPAAAAAVAGRAPRRCHHHDAAVRPLRVVVPLEEHVEVLRADLGEAVGQLLQLEPVGVEVVAAVAGMPEPLPAAATATILPVLGGCRCRGGLALEPWCQRGGDPVGAVLGNPGVGFNSFPRCLLQNDLQAVSRGIILLLNCSNSLQLKR